MRYLLGLDIGSSSVKASLVNSETGQCIASAQSPKEEMTIDSPHPGWAEQDPEMWWHHAVISIKSCLQKSGVGEVASIGISYQMHGLVVVGKDHKPLRPAIIWCDSRAVQIGDKAFKDLHPEYCLKHFLNSPGNFTASKLRWVKENEPEVYAKIYKAMLPGDFIALKLTGEITTTESGLSEGIFWDYEQGTISTSLLDYYKIESDLLPPRVNTFSIQGKLRDEVSKELGIKAGCVVSYRAGDQPNNAFSLNVLNPGETAATAGTSGVIYSITDKPSFDELSRVNAFMHVNNKFDKGAIRNGVLLCVNGTGILNSWLRKNMRGNGSSYDYDHINKIAEESPIGSDGLMIHPFGNGAERILQNKEINATFSGINFNRHTQSHILRAAQEGIVFSLKYGFEILQQMGLNTKVIRAGHANMFLSPLFREAFVNTIGAPLELYQTDGATGAALGSGLGAGIYTSFNETFNGLKLINQEEPNKGITEQYDIAYKNWKTKLNYHL